MIHNEEHQTYLSKHDHTVPMLLSNIGYNKITEMTNFLDIIHRLSLTKDTRRFGDWSLSLSSGKKDTYSVGPN
jgi:hypothetical protein